MLFRSNGSKTIIRSPDANQAVVARYLAKQPRISRASNGSGSSWSFVKVATAGSVVLRSTPGKLAVAQAVGLKNIVSQGDIDSSGYAKYRVDLSQ